MTSPSLVVILSDGIRGHLHQSRGVAHWIAAATGARVIERDVPRFSGIRRFLLMKIAARKLGRATADEARRWLERAGAASLTAGIRPDAAGSPDGVIVISAGSSAAPFTCALGRVLGAKTCVIMTPSVLGTEPFDFAILPEHDVSGHPSPGATIPPRTVTTLATLGAPNAIVPERLAEAAGELLRRSPPENPEAPAWGILLGGDDANYAVTPSWVSKVLAPIVDRASDLGVDVYLTTSRRTSRKTEDAITELARGRSFVRMVLLASVDEYNPVPGMLGHCRRIFCTEDSVSMASEAVTAGHRVILLRVGRKKGLHMILQRLAFRLAGLGLLPSRFVFGVPKFDAMFDRFRERGYLVEWTPSSSRCFASGPELSDVSPTVSGFNEAKRAAEWILKTLS
jgi:mitochondrial fission protein ELM1